MVEYLALFRLYTQIKYIYEYVVCIYCTYIRTYIRTTGGYNLNYLWVIHFVNNNENITIASRGSSSTLWAEQSSDALVLHWDSIDVPPSTVNVTLTVTLPADSALAYWVLEVGNHFPAFNVSIWDYNLQVCAYVAATTFVMIIHNVSISTKYVRIYDSKGHTFSMYFVTSSFRSHCATHIDHRYPALRARATMRCFSRRATACSSRTPMSPSMAAPVAATRPPPLPCRYGYVVFQIVRPSGADCEALGNSMYACRYCAIDSHAPMCSLWLLGVV